MSSPFPSIPHSLLILIVPNNSPMPKAFSPNFVQNHSPPILAKFPVELLVSIFGHLCLQDLLNLEAVCPRWRQIIRRNIWPIQRKIVFTRENDPEFIKQFIAQRGKFLNEIELDGLAEIDEFIPMMAGGQIQRIGISNVNLEQKNSILAKLEEKFG